jgi:hypothetical protein
LVVVGLAYLSLCLLSIAVFVVAIIVGDVCWRMRRRKRVVLFIRGEWLP